MNVQEVQIVISKMVCVNIFLINKYNSLNNPFILTDHSLWNSIPNMKLLLHQHVKIIHYHVHYKHSLIIIRLA